MSKRKKTDRFQLITDSRKGKNPELENHVKLVKGYLKKNGLKTHVVLVRSKKEATSSAERAIKDGTKVVIAMGNDSLIEGVMRGMIGSKSLLGIIPIGTRNNIASSLGIPEDLNEACSLITSGQVRKLDLGQVKIGKGRKFVFFEMVTIGLVDVIYPAAHKAAQGIFPTLKNARTSSTEAEVKPKVSLTLSDKSVIEVETMLVMVANTPVHGKNFKVAPDVSSNDGLLDISVYPNFGKIELLRYSAAVLNGGYSGDGKVQHYQTKKLKIKTSPRLDVMADGVVLGKGEVSIKVLPGALRILTSEKTSAVGKPKRGKVTTQLSPIPPTEEKPVSEKA